MSGDRDRDHNSWDNRDKGRDDRNRDRGRYSRDHRTYSSNRDNRDHSPRPRVKREDYSPPPRQDRRERSPRQRSLSPYSKRAQQTRYSPSSPRKRSPSPEAWGSHQHDLARDRSRSRHTSPPKDKPPKQRPNYGLRGLLAAATNMKNGTVLKYHEPIEAKKCKGWRIYIFKDGKEIDVLELGGQSSFLVGRDRTVADIPVDHTSCSKQHAVIQFRQVSHQNKRGEVTKVTKYRTYPRGADLCVRPYVIDLDATNGTMLNGERIEGRRYVEIHSEDMIKFGESTREYVFIKDPSVS